MLEEISHKKNIPGRAKGMHVVPFSNVNVPTVTSRNFTSIINDQKREGVRWPEHQKHTLLSSLLFVFNGTE